MVELNNDKNISFEELEEVLYLLRMSSDFDLSNYSKSSLKRRVERLLALQQMDLVDLKNALVNIEGFAAYMVEEITVNVTEMFRDPAFFIALRDKVTPYLSTFPRLRLWSAGCSSGEELYSLAILLKKESLLQRSFLYGTDISQDVLEMAKKGVYPTQKIKQYTANFNAVYPGESFANHYTAMYDAAIINHEYRTNSLFSVHNLVSDHVFNEFQLICCRNVLIYFNKTLQERVLRLFYESLSQFGFLCLGSKESLYGHSIREHFKVVDSKYNIFQKIS